MIFVYFLLGFVCTCSLIVNRVFLMDKECHRWLATLLLASLPALLTAQPMHGMMSENKEDPIAEGGRLYDKWWAEYNLKQPLRTHPAYPATGKKKNSTTWRCKECHGWDYRGKHGAYRKGSHYTGIKGIRDYAGGSQQKVLSILKDNNHKYDSVMLEGALQLIARFVVEGQIDMTQYIDDASKKVNGNSQLGRSLFKEHCSRCHGELGKDMNFSRKADKPEYLGTLARDNPWETLHKIRNGHPAGIMDRARVRMVRRSSGRHMMGNFHMGEAMPPMRTTLSVQQQIDLLNYLQTLPVK